MFTQALNTILNMQLIPDFIQFYADNYYYSSLDVTQPMEGLMGNCIASMLCKDPEELQNMIQN